MALRDLYLRRRFLEAVIALVLAGFLAYWFPRFQVVLTFLLLAFAFLLALDVVWLFRPAKNALFARRVCSQKFSNGDANAVDLYLENRLPFKVHLNVIEELPFQFQKRDQAFSLSLDSGAEKRLSYTMVPKKRGVYKFGAINVFASAYIGLVSRRFRFDQQQEVSVYPSFMQMRHYELLAISNRLHLAGLKKQRRPGSSKEFEQIDPYVPGDDYRRMNWKATARHNALMVNRYQDEKSQKVYCLIDKGRAMKMPFEQLTLLDYAINASLVISNIAIQKSDKAGVITFQDKIDSMLPPSSRRGQIKSIMELLHREKTHYRESDLENLYVHLRRHAGSRSLMLLFTNYESIVSLRRQLPMLRLIARKHLLVVVLFQNTEVARVTRTKAGSLQDIYVKGLSEDLLYQKRLMKKELATHGIETILTPPKELTINTINKYLELKSRGRV